MKKHNPNKEQTKLVSRKTNEEIDEDETGRLIIGGKNINDDHSITFNETFAKDTLADQEINKED